MMGRRSRVAVTAAWVAASVNATPAAAFPRVVQAGDSLASIATRAYGDAKAEGVVAAANGLDAEGGVAPVPGMRLEIPAPTYHRVGAGETWPAIAKVALGAETRSDVLARANGTVPWIAPERGTEVVIPYVLAVVATDADRLDTLAKRFWGDANRAWELAAYNGRKDEPVKRGDVLLVPLPSLVLSERGKADYKESLREAAASGDGTVLEAQRRLDLEAAEMQPLLRSGRYVEVVERANRAIGSGLLVDKKEAAFQRALVVAYVALAAPDAAARACARWRGLDKDARLDAARTSPKVRAACLAR
ncbi:MAG: LysM peptidoglycan-binding domain-containing protein [Myxococcales bacterium]|nr:LysM peptidoglycan-binding domain-containing protein [Myxococcales bacterium]